MSNEREWTIEVVDNPNDPPSLRDYSQITVVLKSRLIAAEQRAEKAEAEVKRLSDLQGQTAEGRYQDLRSVHFKEVDEQREHTEKAERERDEKERDRKAMILAANETRYATIDVEADRDRLQRECDKLRRLVEELADALESSETDQDPLQDAVDDELLQRARSALDALKKP